MSPNVARGKGSPSGLLRSASPNRVPSAALITEEESSRICLNDDVVTSDTRSLSPLTAMATSRSTGEGRKRRRHRRCVVHRRRKTPVGEREKVDQTKMVK
ncbi:hypothetical protein TIFTF001_028954 [Ficus carica]|uniref:Uncharacterized protein n=1 Tax=Ficus carica TaxID=3494 RepID=A0AA88J0S2_FICCA|nr:hypothetical protein TIFTF001_028954 [Ficus carica]